MDTVLQIDWKTSDYTQRYYSVLVVSLKMTVVANAIGIVCLLFVLKATVTNEIPIDMDISVSYKQCLQKCHGWGQCKSMQYFSQFKMCEFFDYVYVYCNIETKTCKQDENVKNYVIDENWLSAGATIEVNVCPKHPNLLGATVFGNLRKLESKLKYVCDNDTSVTCVIVCQNNGSWSQTTVECPVGCSVPEFESFQSVNISSMDRFNETHFSVSLVCKRVNQILRPFSKLICDVVDAIWQNKEFICCSKFQK